MLVLSDQIQFQISLLNIASLGAAERQAQELEKLLVEQNAPTL
jgi:hypothetical protein